MSWYVDSSAILSTLLEESGGLDLSKILDETPITSRLSRVEVLRTVNKTDLSLIPRAETLLAQFSIVNMDEAILTRAENYGPSISSKSSDAIHLATAEAVSSICRGIITLDKKMFADAQKLKLTVYQ